MHFKRVGFVTAVVSHSTDNEMVKHNRTVMLKMQQIKYFLDKQEKNGCFWFVKQPKLALNN